LPSSSELSAIEDWEVANDWSASQKERPLGNPNNKVTVGAVWFSAPGDQPERYMHLRSINDKR
jgi:hypothetical protein